MKTTSVPALVYGIACVGCRGQVQFPVFRASFYSFGTFRGPATGSFYRIDLEQFFHQKSTPEDLLRSVSLAQEGGAPLERVPDAMTCPECGALLGVLDDELRSLPLPEEAVVQAVLL